MCDFYTILCVVYTSFCLSLFLNVSLQTHKHRCSLWLLTAGGVRGNAGGKTASITTPSSICFIEGETVGFSSLMVGICFQ